MLETIEVTGQQFIEAVRQNGLPKATKFYFFDAEGRQATAESAVAGCAIGQAARNLNVNPFSLFVELLGIKVSAHNKSLGDLVEETNDKTEMTIPEIADLIDKILTPEEKNFTISVLKARIT